MYDGNLLLKRCAVIALSACFSLMKGEFMNGIKLILLLQYFVFEYMNSFVCFLQCI